MQEITKKQLCSGCHACYNVCPKQCIKMNTDAEGFLYPVINSEECADCGKCRKVCPILNKRDTNPKGCAYACINKEENIRLQSSSGGIFTLIAEYVLQRGGVVFGAAFDRNLCVRHIEVTQISELEKLRGSKYLQSIIGDTYRDVKKHLNNGTMVLFTGTPCQISGLKSFLGKDYDMLITQDIICHGVPSPGIWQKYTKFREMKSTSEIQRMFFRDKKYGWNKYSVLFEFSNSTEYKQIFNKDLFMQGFLANLCLRPSCYRCHAKSVERESDITLADFWGVENISPDMFDNKGTSLVFVNSAKGQKLFDALTDKMIYKPVLIDEAVKYNSSAYKPAAENKKRSAFMKEIQEGDFERVVKKYTKQSLIKRCLIKIKGIIRKVCN